VNAWRVDPAWVERYERLRAHATGQAPLDFIPLDLALLLAGAALRVATRSAP
jgi:hypothetical protein